MFHTTSLRRTSTRLVIGAGAVVAATVALPGAAQAHVSVQPDSVQGGDFSVVAFRVPNERDDASTTQLRVLLPKGQPIGSVQTTSTPGWSAKTTTRHLAKPIDMFGEKLDTVVSQVTWTATGGGVRPGQFQDFSLSLGPLPATGQLRFTAQQTYSDGEQVNWNEVSADPSVEAEHPAPTLAITAAPEAGSPASTPEGSDPAAGSATADQTDQAAAGTAVAAPDSSDSTLSLAMSGAALVLSALAVLLAWRRGRPSRTDEPGRPTRVTEDAHA